MALALESSVTLLGSSTSKSTEQACFAEHRWIARVMRKEGRGIVSMLWRILGNEADVMDVYQDTFCKLAGLGADVLPRYPRAYTYRTASNIAIELIRTRSRRQAHLPRIASMKQTSDVDSLVEPAREEQLEQLRDAIGQLPAHLRQVVVLRDLGGLSYRDVGRSLDIGIGTARVYRRHAIVRLAQILGASEDKASEGK